MIAVWQGKVRRLDDVILNHDDQPLDFISQLSHIAGPGVVNHHVECIRGEILRSTAMFSREDAHEVAGENRYVFVPFAQWGNEEGNHVRSEERRVGKEYRLGKEHGDVKERQ